MRGVRLTFLSVRDESLLGFLDLDGLLGTDRLARFAPCAEAGIDHPDIPVFSLQYVFWAYVRAFSATCALIFFYQRLEHEHDLGTSVARQVWRRFLSVGDSTQPTHSS
jgi:hypothetical protein